MINDFTQHIGTLIISVHIPSAQSLKDKRMVLKSLKDRVRSQFVESYDSLVICDL